MGRRKQKAISRRYRCASELLRKAIDEKLELRRDRLAAQVDCYCNAGFGEEDSGLIEGQAFGRRRSAMVRGEVCSASVPG
jgi:hypothetical protein